MRILGDGDTDDEGEDHQRQRKTEDPGPPALGQPEGQARGSLLRLFVIYMVVNWSWTFIFFTLHEMLAAFCWLLVVNLAAAAIILHGWRIDRKISLLMVPPLLWTCFAAYLNYAYWRLN